MAVDPIWVLIAASLVPPLLFMVWIRSRERRDREPFGALLRAFAFGGTIGIVVALLLNGLFDTASYRFSAQLGVSRDFLIVAVGAPFVEEMAKGLGLRSARRHITELEDGIIYGAAVGLGFAATENLLYGLDQFANGGADAALFLIGLRAVTSTVLHAGSSALLGFGYGIMVLRRGGGAAIVPFYLLAVALHAAYNFLILLGSTLSFVAAIIMVWMVLMALKRRIERLDGESKDTWQRV